MAAGSPWENGYIESFHSRLRDEFLERGSSSRGGCACEGVVVSAGVQHGAAAQLAGLRDAQGVQCGLRPEEDSSTNECDIRIIVDVQGSLPYEVDQKTGSRPPPENEASPVPAPAGSSKECQPELIN